MALDDLGIFIPQSLLIVNRLREIDGKIMSIELPMPPKINKPPPAKGY
jgi:hypothetical protein